MLCRFKRAEPLEKDKILNSALDAAKQGKSVRAAAKEFGIPKSTFSDRASGKIWINARDGKKPHLSKEVERNMVSEAQARAERDIGFAKVGDMAAFYIKEKRHTFKQMVGVVSKKTLWVNPKTSWGHFLCTPSMHEAWKD